MTSNDEALVLIFIVWNNNGYKEIKDSMLAEGIEPVGVRPQPPNFKLQAKSYKLNYYKPRNRNECLKMIKLATKKK